MTILGADAADPRVMVAGVLLADGLDCLRELRGFARAVGGKGKRRG